MWRPTALHGRAGSPAHFSYRYEIVFGSMFMSTQFENSGCGAVRLARVVRDDEAGSSNLPTPTQWLKHSLITGITSLLFLVLIHAIINKEDKFYLKIGEN